MKGLDASPQGAAELNQSLYERLMEEASTLVTSSRSSTLPLDFDTAYKYISWFNAGQNLPVVPSEILGRKDAITTLSNEEFFRLTEAIDAILIGGDEQIQIEAAALVVDMCTAFSYATGLFQSNRNTLTNLLGICFDAQASIQEQLAVRYMPHSELNERMEAIVDGITQRARIVGLEPEVPTR